MALILYAGNDLSKLATEQMTAASCKDWNPGSLTSYSYAKFGPLFSLLSAFFIEPLYHKLAAVILFIVKVPVLSEQIQLVEPRVSTASRFLQSTFLSASLLAVNVNPTVTSTIRPSGTLAVMIPIAKIKFKTAGYPTAKPRPNKIAPTVTAKTVSLIMNLLIYCFNGDYYELALAAKLAI